MLEITKFFQTAPVWTKRDHPKVDVLAKPVAFIRVENQTVVRIKNANYRGAIFDGTFCCADEVVEAGDGWVGVHVYCLWFGHRSKKLSIIMKVESISSFEILNGYTGDVVVDLSS